MGRAHPTWNDFIIGRIDMFDEGSQVKLYERLRRCRPSSREQVAAYAEAFLGLKLSVNSVCKEHNTPLDYLSYSLLNNDNKDIVVWSCRGGGKTQLAAAASLLECVFLPRCQVRILGGSQQQSQRMYEYVQQGLMGGYEEMVDGKITQNICRFVNGSSVQALTQSQSSVRGHHVQRLRCDEVEMFDEDVWQAAQFVTQSKNNISARLEVLSTMHRPTGLMSKIIKNAQQGDAEIFKWCLFDVIEKCVGRSCSRCALLADCRGRAKQAGGHYKIDDAIAQKRRASKAGWQSEMLCKRPSVQDLVFAEFDADINVGDVAYREGLETYRAIDFGFSNPFACLLIQVDSDGMVFVVDKYVRRRATISEHVRVMRERWPYRVRAPGAINQRLEHIPSPAEFQTAVSKNQQKIRIRFCS
ncbi:MAG: hypothetical protein JEZ07_00585 [Phycisphaerae bacterium]|nr:hypothetical protein [Phycisphaerae bacterium]